VANRKKEEAPEGRGGYKSLTPHLTYTRVTHKKCGSIFSSVWETGNAAWCRRRGRDIRSNIPQNITHSDLSAFFC